jgi:hypothetical protein
MALFAHATRDGVASARVQGSELLSLRLVFEAGIT